MNIRQYIGLLNNERQREVLKTACGMGVRFEILSAEFQLLRWKWRGASRVTIQQQMFLNKRPSTDFTKNKEITKLLLHEAGIDVPAGVTATTLREARRRMHATKLRPPYAVKPLNGTKGSGVTVNVRTSRDLVRAFSFAQHAPSVQYATTGEVIIEEMHPGNDHRLLVLDDRLIAGVHRIAPTVVGDGRATIAQLIRRHNRGRVKKFTLQIDEEVRHTLSAHHLQLRSILPRGVSVRLRQHANISMGASALDVTPIIAPRFHRIARAAAAALSLRIAGIDLLTPDIGSNNPRQPSVIIEINGVPEYEIHEPSIARGKGVPTTKMVIESFLS